MIMADKLKNRLRMSAGRLRANYGRAIGDRPLQLQGRWQRIAGASRQLGTQAKDSGKNISRALRKRG